MQRRNMIWIVTLCAALLWGTALHIVDGNNANAGSPHGKIWHESDNGREPYIDPAVNRSMSALVKATLPAVVSIATEQVIKMRRRGPRGRGGEPLEDFFDFFFNQPFGRQFKSQGMGSGFLINEEGYILTNNHVVENADEITVQLNNHDEYQAKVIGRDERTDMALIKIEAGKSLPYLKLGNSSELEIGDTVVAMGNPFGLSQTVTMGIVSQKGRKDINPSGRRLVANFIQTDASINPGNSGGPLLNIYGEAVGINTAIAQGQGIGFAIPINMSKTLLPQLTNGKIERSWIGIGIQDITPTLAESLGLKKARGVLVSSVMENSPAEKAGLKPEDIILSFNGQPVGSPSELTWMASTAGVDTDVTLSVWRNRKTINISLKLGRMPGETGLAAAGDSKADFEALGIHVSNPAPERLKALGISDGKGALVTQIEPDSPAASAGLAPGDIIRKINTVLIKDATHFAKTAKKVKKGQTVRLFVNRERLALFIAFRI